MKHVLIFIGMTPTTSPGWGGHRKGAGRPRPPCGTPHAAGAHRRHAEPVCPSCRAAANAYNRAYYAANPDHGRIRSRLRSNALRRLAALHPVQFAALLRDERERAR
jgi:hypothetical protein